MTNYHNFVFFYFEEKEIYIIKQEKNLPKNIVMVGSIFPKFFNHGEWSVSEVKRAIEAKHWMSLQLKRKIIKS